MLDKVSTLVSTLLALSLVVERVVEMIKGFFPNAWLFLPKENPTEEARRCAALRMFAFAVGSVVTPLSGIQLVTWSQNAGASGSDQSAYLWHSVLNALLSGLLASGGSAFWNHILDLLKAAKVKQELKAQEALSIVASIRNPVRPLA